MLKWALTFSVATSIIFVATTKRGDTMSPRTKSDNPKDTMIRVRMDKETVQKLESCAEALNTTKSEVIRMGIDKVLDTIKK